MAPCNEPEEYIILIMRISNKTIEKINKTIKCMITDFNGVKSETVHKTAL